MSNTEDENRGLREELEDCRISLEGAHAMNRLRLRRFEEVQEVAKDLLSSLKKAETLALAVLDGTNMVYKPGERRAKDHWSYYSS